MGSTLFKHWNIRVPATSANIGPGFDVLGLAYTLYLELDVRLERVASQSDVVHPRITYEGEGALEAPLDPYKNLTTRVALYVLRCHSISSFKSLPFPNPETLQLIIQVRNDVPFGRGLGSSGAAVVAGVLLASAIGDLKLPKSRVLDFTLMVERHPDNVTAALLGGFCGSFIRLLTAEELSTTSVPLAEVLPEFPADASEAWGHNPPVPPERIGNWVKYQVVNEIKAVVVVPKFEVSTAKARGALPPNYGRADTVFNLQRLAVLTTALATSPPDPSVIYEGMQDRLHQPYRAKLIPALPRILSSLSPQTHPGLLGLCLSGAGPTILALATDNFETIGNEICRIFRETPLEEDKDHNGDVNVTWKLLEIDEKGSTLECLKS